MTNRIQKYVPLGHPSKLVLSVTRCTWHQNILKQSQTSNYLCRSERVLSCNSPLIWSLSLKNCVVWLNEYSCDTISHPATIAQVQIKGDHGCMLKINTFQLNAKPPGQLISLQMPVCIWHDCMCSCGVCEHFCHLSLIKVGEKVCNDPRFTWLKFGR